jgi:hypothetical protein
VARLKRSSLREEPWRFRAVKVELEMPVLEIVSRYLSDWGRRPEMKVESLASRLVDCLG